jgi:hypothetical protein
MDTGRTSRRLRLLTWVIFLAVVTSFLGFSAATIDNYTQVVIAKVTASVSLEAEVIVVDAEGGLDVDSQFLIWANYTVTNPSSRSLRMWLIQMKAWLRDYEVEDGKNLQRAFRDDRVKVETEQGVQTLYYYPVLFRTKSYISTVALIDPHSNATFSNLWQISASLDPSTTEDLLSIYNYAITEKGMNPEDLEWHYFAQVLLFVHGVRRDYTGPNDAYLLQLPLIVRWIGVDLG